MDHVGSSFIENNQNGRSSENGNSQLSRAEKERLQYEVELVYRKLLATDDLIKLRELMTRNLLKGNWKHEVLKLCRAAVKNQQSTIKNQQSGQIKFRELYFTVKDEAKRLVSKEIREQMVRKVKCCYQQSLVKPEPEE